MPSTPYAKILVAVNGGTPTAGTQVVQAGDSIQLVPESTQGWAGAPAIYEIFDYPEGWDPPAGWTVDAIGVYVWTAGNIVGLQPNAFTMPDTTAVTTAQQWGKFKFRLTVAGGVGPNTMDETAGVEIISPVCGLHDMAYLEGPEFGGQKRGAIGPHKENLRFIEDLVAGFVAGGVPTTRQVIAGDGMTGGGDLSADVTLDVVALNGTITVLAGGIKVGVITATEHGNLAGGALHAVAVAGVSAGFISAADQSKLDSLAVLTFAAVQAVLAAATGAISVNGQRITSVGTPAAGTDAVNKIYVDMLAYGLDWKGSCRLATTANVGLSGLANIDGVTPLANDRILVKNQSTGGENGIWIAAAGSWTRATDADVDAEVTAGLTTMVTEGATNANTGWTLTTADPIVVGTTALTFTQIFGPGAFIAGNGLTQSGNIFNVVANADGSIVVGADDIRLKVAYQTLLDNATYLNTASTIVMRSPDNGIFATYLWDGVSGPGNEGLVRVSFVGGSAYIITVYDNANDTSVPVLSYNFATGKILFAGTPLIPGTGATGVDMLIDGGASLSIDMTSISAAAPTSVTIQVTGGASLALAATTATLAGGGATAVLGATALTSSVPVIGTYFALTLSGIASVGIVRSTSAAQTLVAARKTGGAADVKAVSIDGSDNMTMGDATNAASLTMASSTGVKLAHGSVVHTIANTSVSFDALAGNITIEQTQRSGNGANAGSTLAVRGQRGQTVAGGTNNDGGDALYGGGLVGSGGSGGNRGSVHFGEWLASLGGGKGVYGLATSYVAPTTSPSGGVLLVVSPEGALMACATSATTTPTHTTLAPPVTDTGAVGFTRWDVLGDRYLKQTNDGSTVTLWSYTPNAGETVQVDVTVLGRRGTTTLRERRMLFVNLGDAIPALTNDLIGTAVNTSFYTGGGAAITCAYSSGTLKIDVKGDAAVGNIFTATVHDIIIFKP
jgi:hypothetical protein